MYVTNGSIAELNQWFHGSENKHYDLMFLIAAGGYYDDVLIRDIIEKGPTYDSVTGRRTVFFLFTNRDDFFVLTGQSEIIVPGTKLGCTNMIKKRRVADVKNCDPDGIYRTSIEVRTQTIVDDICNYYNLSPSTIPCFLLVVKGIHEPFIIKTRGSASAMSLYGFFKKLQKILKDVKGALKDDSPDIVDKVLIDIEKLCKDHTNKYVAYSVLLPIKKVLSSALATAKMTSDIGKNIRDLMKKP